VGNWVHGYAIADFTRDLLHALYNSTDGTAKATLSVKYVSVGNLAHHVMNAALSSDLPFIMVDIADPAPQDVSTLQNLETRYRVRVLFVRKFASGEDAHKDKMQGLEVIANALQDNQAKFLARAGSGNISLTGGAPINMRLDGLEYVAPEEDLFEGVQQNIVASAVSFLIHIDSAGS